MHTNLRNINLKKENDCCFCFSNHLNWLTYFKYKRRCKKYDPLIYTGKVLITITQSTSFSLLQENYAVNINEHDKSYNNKTNTCGIGKKSAPN